MVVSPTDTHAALASAGTLLDVRSGVEFDTEHVEGSVHIPLDALDRHLHEVRALGTPLHLLCRTGARADRAREQLLAAGLTETDVHVIEGGLEAWRAAGLGTVTGTARMSLERQVRVAAGSLVLTGVALGFLVHPGCFGLAGFVGAGLVFAGITDW